MTDLGQVYARGRERVTALVSGLSEEEAARRTAACPEWSVHDVVAHLTGVCDDVLTGNIEGVASDPWTAAQVDKRRGVPLDDVVAEWNEKAPQVEPIVQFFPGLVGKQFILDFTTHEHDIRHALGRPGAQDSEGVDIGLDFMASVGLLPGGAVRGVPPLEVVAGDRRWVVGTGTGVAAGVDPSDEAAVAAAVQQAAGQVLTGAAEPPVADVEPLASLKVSPFELMRALSGRRSRDQIRAYDWSTDPEPYLPLFQFGPFRTRPDALVE